MADWIEPSDDELMKCPHCDAKTAKRRFLLHLSQCYGKILNPAGKVMGQTKKRPIIVCPFNREHHILSNVFDEHLLKCTDAKSSTSSNRKGVPEDQLSLDQLSLAESYERSPHHYDRFIRLPGSHEEKYINLYEEVTKMQEDPKYRLPAVTLKALSPADRRFLRDAGDWLGIGADSGDNKDPHLMRI